MRNHELELFAKKAALVAALVLGMLLLWRVRGVLVLVFIAAVIAAGIAPAVQNVRLRWRFWFHRNIPRGAAVLVVYIPFLIVTLLIATVVVPRLLSEAQTLGAEFPALVQRDITEPLEHYFPTIDLSYLGKGGSIPRSSLFVYVRSTATAIASFIAVLFMVAYMLIDAHRLRNTILLFCPAEARSRRRRTLNRIAARMSSWLMAQLILSAIMGGALFVALLLLRVPFALPLAIVAMVGEIVPVIGPIVGCAPALLMALLHSRWQFWSLLVIVVVLQKLENLFISPRVMAKKVSISPLAAIIGFMAGATLLGIAGAIIAIPITAIVQVAFEEVFVKRRERRLNVGRAGTLLRRVD
ncbi:MAG TPA: AI-2E family transporter [Thermoanaerobaculia bacterium]